jgi:hypothetical protein
MSLMSDPALAELYKSKKDWTLTLQTFAAATQPYLIIDKRNYDILFWFKLDQNNGFRVTQHACDLLLNHGYSAWTYIMKKEIVNTGKILLLLDKNITTPWHLSGKILTIFDPQLAVAMSLTQQDLVQSINMTY